MTEFKGSSNYVVSSDLLRIVNISIALEKPLLIKGEPGTGKTMMARLMSRIYRSLGILSKGQLVEVGRGDLVGKYVGWTAQTVQAKFREAKGGVLFIDEAYSLSSGGEDDFGRESIETILKAKETGKIKIKKIDDLTTDKVNIIITLPNDVSPDKTIDALYAFTACEVSITPNTCVILDNKPQVLSVNDMLRYSTEHTKDLLGQELTIRLNELANDWHYSSLEKIFFENKVYKILEGDAKSWEEQLEEVYARMLEFQKMFNRPITMEDINKLVEKPVRKISKFDVKAVDEKLRGIEAEIEYFVDCIEKGIAPEKNMPESSARTVAIANKLLWSADHMGERMEFDPPVYGK